MGQKIDVNFKLLADRPDLINLLATWFHGEWGHRSPSLTVDVIAENLGERLNRDCLPLTFVAFVGEEPVGSATLKIQEMELFPQYIHWLGSVYVIPERRNQGLGTQLVEHAIVEANRLDVKDLYLYTRGNDAFYAKFKWLPVERVHYHGREVVVMMRTIRDRGLVRHGK